MIPQLFRKKQESSPQFCHCFLTPNSNYLASQGEKFLTRPQTQPLKATVQVNYTVKVIESKKQRQIKHSLKTRQKNNGSVENTCQRGYNVHQIQKSESKVALNSQLQMSRNQPQDASTIRFKAPQNDQHSFRQQNPFRQQLGQLKMDLNHQSYQKRANTEKSTYMSNLTGLKNSIDVPPAKNYSTKHQSKDSISVSASSLLLNESPHEMPRSCAFSTKFIGIASGDLQLGNQQTQNLQQPCNDEPNRELSTFKLTDLAFKSAQSISQSSSDQFSELASSFQYCSHPSIAQESWSTNLNEIFANKIRRLSHNPNA